MQRPQQINHMQMSFLPPQDNAHNRSPTSSTSSLDSNYSSDSSCSSTRNSPSPPATAAGASSSSSTPSIGVNLRVTGQCSQGGRKYMEDYFSVAYQQSENAKDLEYAFIGIYDGHGGAEAATFAKEHLMLEIINQKLFWSDSDQDVLRAIREGYIATHYAMWRDQENWPKTANGLPSTAGTTATVAFIRREKIYIGHVGDSGIVLGYQNDNENFWRAKQLTTDHKPESMAERTRIMKAGGKVIVKSGVPRVVWNRPRSAHKGPIRQNTLVDEIPFLAVARSLGDLWSYNSELNEFIVSPDPDVKVIKINPNTFRCLIFGTDGLWNVVTAQNAVDTVYQKETINERLQAQRGESPNEGAQWTNPSKSLVEQALKTWSAKKMRADNTSVVTVILYPPGNNATENTPATVSQPDSYGLEYKQVNAEIPTNGDATTYREMAQKYLPPEQYRNFNFYDEDEVAAVRPLTAEEQSQIDPITVKNIHAGNVYWHNMNSGGGHEEITKTPFANGNDIWRWNEKSERLIAAEGSTMAEMDSSNIDADDKVVVKSAGGTDINYTDYVATDIPASLNGIIATAASDCMNGFAATYNTLLGEQMTHEASTSNSNPSSYHSLSGSSMHEILQEQHRYQQECMSEEEGYSLTKLETRREQQRCTAVITSASGVQTFKIFQQNQESNVAATTANYEQSTSKPIGSDEAPTNYWKLSYPPTSGAVINKFMPFQQQQEQKQPQQPKPLELNSLLEQEREEEQQVALERQELLRKLATEATANKSTDVGHEQTTPEAEEPLIEEYLDEELAAAAHDETVQINEISSSMTDSMQASERTESTSASAGEPMDCEMLVDDEHPDYSFSIEKIEILHEEDSSLLREGASEKPTTLQCAHSTKSTKSDRAAQASAKRAQTFYPNIPNENQRSTVAFPTYTLNRYRRLDQSSASTSGPSTSNSSGSCNSEKRQLRSSSGIVDYSKRTLRTRNSLTKDMKAKSTLASTLKRTTTTASHFLRTTAASLLGSSNNNSNTSATALAAQNATSTCGSSNKKLPKVEKHTILAPPVTNAINLRSRQIGHATVTLPSPVTPPNNHCITAVTSTPTINATPLLHRRERRNLRSLSTRSMGSREPTPSSPAGFSKSTRLQSSTSTLAAPPPSPKLINAAAAVAAATRARSLLSKNTAAIQAVFGKRSALRSGGSTVASSGTISSVDQTARGRVSKKRRHRR